MKKVPASYWADCREDGLLIIDNQNSKFAVLPAKPYQIVFVINEAGQEVVVDLSPEKAQELVNRLQAIIPECTRITAIADAEYQQYLKDTGQEDDET